jgi:homoserine kinase type II
VVLVADFDFMGERARIDDVALTLYFANLSLGGDPAAGESATALRRLLDAYDGGLEVPLTEQERAALPWAVARQPLWGIGGWVRLLDDEATARRHAAGVTPGMEWALAVTQDVERWRAAFA